MSAVERLNRVLGRRGWSLQRSDASDLADLPDETRRIIEQVKPFTMTSAERLNAAIESARYVVRRGLPGAIVECGVWRGGSAMAMALALLSAGDSSRDLYLFDTFEGMPEPDERDRDHTGAAASALLAADREKTSLVTARASFDEVRTNLESTGYPMDKIFLVRGMVEETVPSQAPKQIALLRLDTDWYASTAHELLHLFPRMPRGGVLIVDDYGHWQGARRAVDEFLLGAGRDLLLHRIDYTGRIAVVP